MLATPAQIDESIEKRDYQSAIKQIKTSLYFAETTEESLKNLNTKLLKCLDLANFGVHKEILEIENIIKDKIIFENLSTEQKADLYSTLGDNLLKLGSFEEALINYNIGFHLGNKDVFKEIVFLNIFLSLKENPTSIETKASLSDIVSALELNEKFVEYSGILKSEFISFLFGEYVAPAGENNIMVELYKLEAQENIALESIGKLKLTNIQEINLVFYDLRFGLEKGYEDLAEDFSSEIVEIPKQNMLKRASGEEVPYLYYGEHIKEFISFGFDIIETYLKSDNYEDSEKSLFIINFLTESGFKNLDLDKMEYLFDLLIDLLKSHENLPDLYLQRLYSIIGANLSSGEDVASKSFILMGNISLRLGFYDWAYKAFVSANNAGLLIRQNIKELLESMLLYKKFKRVNEAELQFGRYLGAGKFMEVKKQEMEPEIQISLLLEKIEKGLVLKIEDYKIIESLTEK